MTIPLDLPVPNKKDNPRIVRERTSRRTRALNLTSYSKEEIRAATAGNAPAGWGTIIGRDRYSRMEVTGIAEYIRSLRDRDVFVVLWLKLLEIEDP